jgi:DNA-binding NarL/FixJ family response regulator
MSEAPTTVIIVEDEPEFRRRFAQIVESEPSMRLAGVASTRREAQALLEKEHFDVLLIDLGLPDGNGIDLIKQVSQTRPEADIMVVTVFGDEQHVVSSIEAGATGYILKDSTPADVISCIRLLRAGGSPVSPVVARSVLRAIRNRMAAEPATRAPQPESNPLSTRETEILQRDRGNPRHLAAHRDGPHQEDLPETRRALARRSRVRSHADGSAARLAQVRRWCCAELP